MAPEGGKASVVPEAPVPVVPADLPAATAEAVARALEEPSVEIRRLRAELAHANKLVEDHEAEQAQMAQRLEETEVRRHQNLVDLARQHDAYQDVKDENERIEHLMEYLHQSVDTLQEKNAELLEQLQETGNVKKANEFLKRQTGYLESETAKIASLTEQTRESAAKIRRSDLEIATLRNEVELKEKVDKQLADLRAKYSELTKEKHTLDLELVKLRSEKARYAKLEDRNKHLQEENAKFRNRIEDADAVYMERDRLKGKKTALAAR